MYFAGRFDENVLTSLLKIVTDLELKNSGVQIKMVNATLENYYKNVNLNTLYDMIRNF